MRRIRAQVRKAVADIVARQVAIGIDVVSDGESSKVGYATYVKDRLTGLVGSRLCRSLISMLRLCGFPPAAGVVHRAAAIPTSLLHRADCAAGP